jgi:hypothetical protein
MLLEAIFNGMIVFAAKRKKTRRLGGSRRVRFARSSIIH